MKYLSFIWHSAWRKKIRTSLTVLSVFVAFLLFAILSAISDASQSGGQVADDERLITIDKVSLINLLPISYKDRIASIDGVDSVVHSTWFGGVFQDSRNQFPQHPVDPYEYMSMFPELDLPPEQLESWARNRTGAIVGQDLAELYGWEVGDRVPIQSTIWRQKDGSRTWEFDIEGVFTTSDPRGSTLLMLFHYDFFDEARIGAQGLVGWYTVRVADGFDLIETMKAIDREFANSPNETKTTSETEFTKAFAAQLGNIALLVTFILAAVFFTLLLVSGNTMSQSVRERFAEIAVLKTLGFEDRSVLGIVLAESILIMMLGGLLGLAAGWALIVSVIEPTISAFLPGVYLSPTAILTAVLLMIAAGVAAGFFPAFNAMRLKIVDALARG